MSTLTPVPPPLLSPPRASMERRVKWLIAFAVLGAIVAGALLGLRAFGLLRPFYMPTSSMRPAVSAGDHVFMEGVSFLAGRPKRGDIVAFKTDGIPSVSPGNIYMKRLVGEPGEHVRLANGRLYINGARVGLTNSAGEIAYLLLPGAESRASMTDLTVPAVEYFVVGDNSTNSMDSRFWGGVPAKNILGRIWFCYWPPQRIGVIK